MTEISVEERRLLDSVLTSEKNGSGHLMIHEEEALKQLRGAAAYLENKYPGIKIRMRLFDPLTKISGKGLLICSVSSHETLCRTFISTESGRYIFTDTVYGVLLRERYDHLLEDILSGFCPDAKAYTVFYTPAGDSIDADASVEALAKHDPCISRHTDIFTHDGLSVTEELRAALKKGRFFASYSVWSDTAAGKGERMNFSVFPGEGETA